MKTREFITKLPIPGFGLSLGLVSFEHFLSHAYDQYSYGAFAALAAGIAVLFAIRIIIDHRGVLKEIENPAVFGVLPIFTMTIMLLIALTVDYLGDIALVVWLSAIAASFIMMIFFIKKFILKFSIEKVFPSWAIIFVGYVVASVTSPDFGMADLGKVIFWIGFVCFIVLLPVLAYRTLKVRKIPEPLIPQIMILAAPANLCIVGCFSAFGDSPPEIVLMILAVLGVAIYIAVMAYMPIMLRIKFYPSFAVLTFPPVISTISFYMIGEYYGLLSNDLFYLLWFVTLIAAILINVYILLRYVVLMYHIAKSTDTN